MPKEKQVVSLELAQKLKELSVPQKSLFYWKKYYHNGEERIELQMNVEEDYPERCSAFTVAELGEMLPMYVNGKYVELPQKVSKHLYNSKPPTKEETIWSFHPVDDDCVLIEADTEADARAKMLIYLLENKLITV